MDNISKEKMLEYLEQAAELEMSVFEQKLLIARCEQEMQFPEFVNEVGPAPKNGSGKVSKPNPPKYLKGIIWQASLVAAFIFGFLGYVISGMYEDDRFLWGGLGIVAFCILLTMLGLRTQNKNNAIRRGYEKELRSYNKKVDAAERKYKAEVDAHEADLAKHQSRIQAVENMLQQIQGTYRETQGLLDRLYGNQWIFEEYRDLIAICSFYEYFSTGRVQAMDGPEGAYALLNEEIENGRVKVDINEILAEPAAIAENQAVLYQVVMQCFDNLQTVMEKVHRILFLGIEEEPVQEPEQPDLQEESGVQEQADSQSAVFEEKAGADESREMEIAGEAADESQETDSREAESTAVPAEGTDTEDNAEESALNREEAVSEDEDSEDDEFEDEDSEDDWEEEEDLVVQDIPEKAAAKKQSRKQKKAEKPAKPKITAEEISAANEELKTAAGEYCMGIGRRNGAIERKVIRYSFK